MLDVFKGDAFTLTKLTAAINELPYQPGRIGASGLFSEEGVTTTTVLIEFDGDKLALVPNVPRGAPAQPKSTGKRRALPFLVPHLPQRSTIMADQVQGVREFGSEDATAGVQAVVNRHLANHRRDLEVTIEYHRMGAIQGMVLDADGEAIFDLFTYFGVTQQTHVINFSNANTKVLAKVIEAKGKIEDYLGGQMITGFRAYCSPEFFAELVSHPAVEKAYERWRDGQFLRTDNRQGFMFGDVEWIEYRGSVGDRRFIEAGAAYLLPVGVPDLFITRFAPADYVETVNTVGLPFYSKQELLRFGKGVELESQSNPLNLLTRPRAVVKLTLS